MLVLSHVVTTRTHTSSSQGRTVLHAAAERGDVKEVERLLSTSVNINSRTEDVSLSTSNCPIFSAAVIVYRWDALLFS